MTVNKLILILLIVWFGLLILYSGFSVESLAMRPYEVPNNYSGRYTINTEPVYSQAIVKK
jgi:hypothetical protein